MQLVLFLNSVIFHQIKCMSFESCDIVGLLYSVIDKLRASAFVRNSISLNLNTLKEKMIHASRTKDFSFYFFYVCTVHYPSRTDGQNLNQVAIPSIKKNKNRNCKVLIALHKQINIQSIVYFLLIHLDLGNYSKSFLFVPFRGQIDQRVPQYVAPGKQYDYNISNQ